MSYEQIKYHYIIKFNIGRSEHAITQRNKTQHYIVDLIVQNDLDSTNV